jgi:ElaA protein
LTRQPRWVWLGFEELSVESLYDILALRQAIFVVEQRCAYLDADGKDRQAWHLQGLDASGTLVAALRLLAPGSRFLEPSLGRIVVRAECRGKGFGKLLTLEGLRQSAVLYPGQAVRISAQKYLREFYESLGFATQHEGNPYDEDGIPHIEMLHPPL